LQKGPALNFHWEYFFLGEPSGILFLEEKFMFTDLRYILKDLARDYRLPIFCVVAAIGTFAGHYNQGIYGSKILGIISIVSLFVELGIFYWGLNAARTRNGMEPRRSGFGLYLSIYAFRLRLLLMLSPLIGLFFYLGGFGKITEAYTLHTLGGENDRQSFTLLLLKTIWEWVIVLWIGLALDQVGRAHVLRTGFAKGALKAAFVHLPKVLIPLLIILALEFLFFFSDFLEVFTFPSEKGRLWITPLCLSVFLPLKYFLEIGGSLWLAKLIRSSEQHPLN
jgi:hypothetical protein